MNALEQATVLDLARDYIAAGFSVCPIRADGSKAPACRWKELQSRQATERELEQWFASGRYGIAIIGGEVSGGLEVLDFDSGEAFDEWQAKVPAELLDRLPIIETPRGFHVYLRSNVAFGNLKLASGDGRTLIETRGEGGYVLAPGCPRDCHQLKRLYVHVSGPQIAETPVIEDKERNFLFRVARKVGE